MSSDAVRTAILGAIRSAVSPVPAYSGRVPERTSYPYVLLGQSVAVTDTGLTDRQVETYYISVWSQATNDTEVGGLLAAMRTALHNQRLALSSGHLAGLFVRSVEMVPDIDERTFTGRLVVDATHQ